ncbi:hypothetical protein L7F22_049044 [Adiantum nelumboides]|nr:hypothetical protein [Adiantum nelumboides]
MQLTAQLITSSNINQKLTEYCPQYCTVHNTSSLHRRIVWRGILCCLYYSTAVDTDQSFIFSYHSMKPAAVPAAVLSSTCTYSSSSSAPAVDCTSGASVDTTSSSNVSTATSTEHVEEEAYSQSYIMKVQHLIERCLIFYLDREECVEALFQHAEIDPIITRTVWKELEKENQDFFERYNNSERDTRDEDKGQSSRMLLIQANLSDKARF